MNMEERIRKLRSEEIQNHLAFLYGGGWKTLNFQLARYEALLRRHEEIFGPRETVMIFSGPGRTEIGGNHTDHNRGRVLAGSINLDLLCAVSPREDNRVSFYSEGREPSLLELSDTEVNPTEEGTTSAIIRGVADGMKRRGYRIGGFDAAADSTVAAGGGMSSSAALEIMLSGVFDGLYNDFSMPFADRAQIGRRAENLYFGKPSGLLDQMASAAGGLVTVDFADEQNPVIEPISYDFAARGYRLVVVATGGSHENLTDCYAAIPQEMKAVAAVFGRDVLRGLTEQDLLSHMAALRSQVSDRAILRAFHFITENDRVPEQVAALKEDRIEDFLRLITDSGRSSFQYLQNIYASEADQSLSLALCMAESMLKGKGAWRIHGGGFAGTTLNFVPEEDVENFVRVMNDAFGEGACHVLNIRPVGADMIVL